jgi:hypothetical protein
MSLEDLQVDRLTFLFDVRLKSTDTKLSEEYLNPVFITSVATYSIPYITHVKPSTRSVKIYTGEARDSDILDGLTLKNGSIYFTLSFDDDDEEPVFHLGRLNPKTSTLTLTLNPYMEDLMIEESVKLLLSETFKMLDFNEMRRVKLKGSLEVKNYEISEDLLRFHLLTTDLNSNGDFYVIDTRTEGRKTATNFHYRSNGREDDDEYKRSLVSFSFPKDSGLRMSVRFENEEIFHVFLKHLSSILESYRANFEQILAFVSTYLPQGKYNQIQQRENNPEENESKIQALKRLGPSEIFEGNNYSRKCQKESQPEIISEERALQLRGEQSMQDSIAKYGDTIYACLDPKYRFLNFLKFPESEVYYPCCYKKSKKKYGKDLKIQDIVNQGLYKDGKNNTSTGNYDIIGSKILAFKSSGILPNNLSLWISLLTRTDLSPQAFRLGVNPILEGTSSLIHSILKAGGESLSEEYVTASRQSGKDSALLMEKIALKERYDIALSPRINLSVCRQELYDLSDEEIRDQIFDTSVVDSWLEERGIDNHLEFWARSPSEVIKDIGKCTNLDPFLHYRCLEEYYGITLLTLSYPRDDRVNDFLTLPRHKHFHSRRFEDKPLIVVITSKSKSQVISELVYVASLTDPKIMTKSDVRYVFERYNGDTLVRDYSRLSSFKILDPKGNVHDGKLFDKDWVSILNPVLQELDSEGKVRSLGIEIDGKIYLVSVEPCQPYNLPSRGEVTLDRGEIMSNLGDRVEISQENDTIWLRDLNLRILTNSSMNGDFKFREQREALRKIETLKSNTKVLLQLVRWRWSLDGRPEFGEWFQERYLPLPELDGEYDLGSPVKFYVFPLSSPDEFLESVWSEVFSVRDEGGLTINLYQSLAEKIYNHFKGVERIVFKWEVAKTLEVDDTLRDVKDNKTFNSLEDYEVWLQQMVNYSLGQKYMERLTHSSSVRKDPIISKLAYAHDPEMVCLVQNVSHTDTNPKRLQKSLQDSETWWKALKVCLHWERSYENLGYEVELFYRSEEDEDRRSLLERKQKALITSSIKGRRIVIYQISTGGELLISEETGPSSDINPLRLLRYNFIDQLFAAILSKTERSTS